MLDWQMHSSEDSCGLQPAQNDLPNAIGETLMPARVVNDLGTIKAGAQGRGVRILTTQTTADTAIDDGRDWINFQRIGIIFQGQCRAS